MGPVRCCLFLWFHGEVQGLFLPSGIHDNAMIQSISHLLPFTILEETIMGCDGPLSSDEDYSHFLDGCVSVLCVECTCACVLYCGRGLFHNTRAT